jgi:hypothetical protein
LASAPGWGVDAVAGTAAARSAACAVEAAAVQMKAMKRARRIIVLVFR